MINKIQRIICKHQKVDDGNKSIVNVNDGIQWDIHWFKEYLMMQADSIDICAWKWQLNYGFSVFINLMTCIGSSVDNVSAKDSSSSVESVFITNWIIGVVWFSPNALLTSCRKNS